MYSDRIKSAQRVLRACAGYRGAIDGMAGRQTLAAAWRIGHGHASADELLAWPVDRQVIAAAQAALHNAGYEPGPVDGFWGPQTDSAFAAWRGDVLPDRRGEAPFGYQADMHTRFGAAGGPDCTAGLVRPPWRMVLAWDAAQVVDGFACHKALAASAQRAFDRIAAAYNPVQIRDLGLHLYGGCFNMRAMRGGSSLSTHAWGAAVDFDPARNRLHWSAPEARLSQPDAVPFWDAWEAEGWTSLGRARGYDWMHVQAPAL